MELWLLSISRLEFFDESSRLIGEKNLLEIRGSTIIIVPDRLIKCEIRPLWLLCELGHPSPSNLGEVRPRPWFQGKRQIKYDLGFTVNFNSFEWWNDLPPIFAAFSMTQTLKSSSRPASLASCLSLMAAAKPDGPPPTIATSTSSSYRVQTSSSSTISAHLNLKIWFTLNRPGFALGVKTGQNFGTNLSSFSLGFWNGCVVIIFVLGIEVERLRLTICLNIFYFSQFRSQTLNIRKVETWPLTCQITQKYKLYIIKVQFIIRQKKKCEIKIIFEGVSSKFRKNLEFWGKITRLENRESWSK